VLRRACASGLRPKKIVDALTIFSGSSRIEGVHPLQFGIVRRKNRRQRRHGLPIENPLVFYARRTVEATLTALRWYGLVRRYNKIMQRVKADANAAAYTDQALRLSKEADDFVEKTFADKIPDTYGAPPKHAAAAVQAVAQA
jgi:hypothetical protein